MLSESQKPILQEIIAATKDRRGVSINVLFNGTDAGQTSAAADLLAKESRRELHRVELSTVVSKYIGETEKNLHRVFEAGSSRDVILFFDEANALFGKRSDVKDCHDRYANAETNFLLQRLESYKGLAILATNEEELPPFEFLRHFRYVVDFC